MKRVRILVTLAALMSASMAMIWASSGGGGGSAPTPTRTAPRLTPEQMAVQHYNTGLKYRDKAWKHEKKSQAATQAKKKDKEHSKAQKDFAKAIKEYRKAVKLVDGFYQAYGSLGYALRKTGQYEEALKAYNQSLSLNPNYVNAIEYRGEAYLGLHRVEDAKKAYLSLFRLDKSEAEKLLTAMKKYVAASSDAAGLQEFSSWIQERHEIAQQTAPSSGGDW